MNINILQYFGKWVGNTAQVQNATVLLAKVNALLDRYEGETGKKVKVNPVTGSSISGTRYGGFRPQDCPEGAPMSSHKQGEGVDVYDPDNALDDWLTDGILEEAGLYREHPDDTPRWCHLTTRAPRSGRRTFKP